MADPARDPDLVEMPPLRGFPVGEPGTYVLVSDVADAILRMASLERGEARAALIQASEWFGQVIEADESERPEAPHEVNQDDRCGAFYDGAYRCDLDAGHGGRHLHTSRADGRSVTWDEAEVDAIESEVKRPAPPAPPPDRVEAVEVDRIARVEVYPNEDASYWYGRAVDHAGVIVAQPHHVAGIRRELVHEAAAREWPDAPVYEIPDALTDSIFSESNPAASWNGRPRPSTQRLFGR